MESLFQMPDKGIEVITNPLKQDQLLTNIP